MMRFCILLILLFNSILAHSQYHNLTGHWSGMLTFAERKMDILFLFIEKDGKLIGSLSSEKLQMEDLPMSSISFDPPELSVVVPMAGGQWEGELHEDSLKGHWIQGPYKAPLHFHRLDQEPELKIAGREQTPSPPFPYSVEEITYTNARDQVQLAATLTIPKGDGPFAAAILLSVAGLNDRDQSHGAPPHKPYMVLADYLSRHGIAVLRSDDRGVGGSSGDLFQSTLEDFANDAIAAFQYLKAREDINPSKIGFIGNSEGSLVGPLAAFKIQEAAFIITLGGIGISGSEVILDQIVSLGRLAGMSEEEIESTQDRTGRLFDILTKAKDSTESANQIRHLIKESPARANPIFLIPQDSEQQVRLFNSPWYTYQIQYDPAPVLQGINCPFLAIHGDRDPFVQPDKNLSAIANHLQLGNNPHYALIKLKNVNHIIQDAESGSPLHYSENENSFSPRVLELILAWLKVHVMSDTK